MTSTATSAEGLMADEGGHVDVTLGGSATGQPPIGHPAPQVHGPVAGADPILLCPLVRGLGALAPFVSCLRL